MSPAHGDAGVKIAAVGDISLADQPLCVGHGVRSVAERRGHDWLFCRIKRKLEGYDHVLGNLEKVLSGTGAGEEHGFRARMNKGSGEAAHALKRAGFSVLSLANNHIFEHGPAGITDTVSALDLAGIAHIGTRYNPGYVAEANGASVAFIAWTLIPDSYWPDLDPMDFYNLADSEERILEAVEDARRQADHVVVSLHWGNEFVGQPSTSQQKTAHRLVDAGASAVIGHHSHVLQPVEIYKRRLIAYSLGNFVFDSIDRPGRRGMILEVELQANVTWACHPMVISKSYQPTPVSDPGTKSVPGTTPPDLHPQSEDTYRDEVFAARWRYRRAALLYVAGNAWRYRPGDLGRLLVWVVKRAFFVLKISRRERVDPLMVYRGPMK